MPCDSESVVGRWVDNSPRAEQIAVFRAQKEVEDRARARQAAKNKLTKKEEARRKLLEKKNEIEKSDDEGKENNPNQL